MSDRDLRPHSPAFSCHPDDKFCGSIILNTALWNHFVDVPSAPLQNSQKLVPGGSNLWELEVMGARMMSAISIVAIAAGLILVTSGQAQAACTPFANRPSYIGNTLTGWGGQNGCGSTQSAIVYLRHDRTLLPDTTMSQSPRRYGNFEWPVTTLNPPNGQYYTETRSSTGAKARSANRSVG